MILDLAEMPGTDPDKVGSHGLHSVSGGKVRWDPEQKAVCAKHGAINCVSQDRRIWRCVHAFPSCREGCYRPAPTLHEEKS
jgi:hypothetical protein